MLVAIKLLHTVIWAILAGMIVVLPIAAILRRFRLAAILSGIILVECAVLGVNGGRCPLTDMAAKYTSARTHNFDIYLPGWLAQHNKQIFGSLFVAGELVFLAAWLWKRQRLKARAEAGDPTATGSIRRSIGF